MNEDAFWRRIKHLELLDQSVNVKHLPRKKWPEEYAKNNTLLWQIPRTTASLIHTFVKQKQPRMILELGTSGGYSTLWFSHSAPDSIIHTIEFSESRAKIAKESFEQTGVDNIILHRGKIASIIKNWKDPIDLLFIDADKPAYLDNFLTLEKLLTTNSMIIADNILDNPEKVKPFVDHMLNHSDFITFILKVDNGLLVALKK